MSCRCRHTSLRRRDPTDLWVAVAGSVSIRHRLDPEGHELLTRHLAAPLQALRPLHIGAAERRMNGRFATICPRAGRHHEWRLWGKKPEATDLEDELPLSADSGHLQNHD